MSNDQCRIFLHNFAYFSFFFCKTIYTIYLNKFKLHDHVYMYLNLYIKLIQVGGVIQDLPEINCKMGSFLLVVKS